MTSQSNFQIYSQRQQGLAETSRLILEYAGATYENVFVEDWEREKSTTPLGLLPVLRVQNHAKAWVQISESHAMERFLSTSLGLMGSDAIQAAQLDMYYTSWTDMMGMFMWRVWRMPDDESKAQGSAAFWEAFPKFLQLHEKVLAERTPSGPFYSGSKPSLVDLYAFTWLNRFITKFLPCPSGAVTQAKFPLLWTLWEEIRDVKPIQDYFQSGRWNLK